MRSCRITRWIPLHTLTVILAPRTWEHSLLITLHGKEIMSSQNVSTANPPSRSLTEAIDEIFRELQVRKRCFPRWIEDGKISRTDAQDRIARQESALAYLESLRPAESSPAAEPQEGRPF